MPRRYTMATLIERCRQRCDMVGDDSIGDPEWRSLISEVYGEMWSEVSISVANRYFETSSTISADGSTSYDEPSDHYATQFIAELRDDGTERRLREIQPFEEPAYRGRTGTPVGWLLVDDQLYLCPAPASGTYVWHYTAQPTDLVDYADDDVVDVISPAGESFLIWGVTILAKAKGGKDVQLAMTGKERARELLQIWAANRNLTDVRTRGPIMDDDGGIRRPTWDEP